MSFKVSPFEGSAASGYDDRFPEVFFGDCRPLTPLSSFAREVTPLGKDSLAVGRFRPGSALPGFAPVDEGEEDYLDLVETVVELAFDRGRSDGRSSTPARVFASRVELLSPPQFKRGADFEDESAKVVESDRHTGDRSKARLAQEDGEIASRVYCGNYLDGVPKGNRFFTDKVSDVVVFLDESHVSYRPVMPEFKPSASRAAPTPPSAENTGSAGDDAMPLEISFELLGGDFGSCRTAPTPPSEGPPRMHGAAAYLEDGLGFLDEEYERFLGDMPLDEFRPSWK